MPCCGGRFLSPHPRGFTFSPVTSELPAARSGPADEFEYPLFRRMRALVQGQAELIAVSDADRIDLTYGSDEETEKAYQQYVSGWMFHSLGIQPALGRVFTGMRVLVAAQVAFCVLVVFVAGLFMATSHRLSLQRMGFSAERLLALEAVTAKPVSDVLWSQVADRLRTVPGSRSIRPL